MLVLLSGSGSPAHVAADPAAPEAWSSWATRTIPADCPRTDTLAPRTIWTLDCAAETDQLIGRIVSAAPGSGGRTLLVDRQLCRVIVVDAGGRIERVVGRRGEGPGELQGAWRALQFADGRIGIMSGAPPMTMLYGDHGRIVLRDGAGHPAGVWLAGGEATGMPFCTPREMRCAGGPVLVATYRFRPEAPLVHHVRELALLAPPDGTRSVVARSVITSSLKIREIEEEECFEPFAHGRCDISASGRVAFAPERDRWLVAIREPEGSGFLVERPWQARERSASDRRRALELLGELAEGGILDRDPAIGRIRWRPDGCLWVEPFGVEPDEGAFACFDELGPEGDLRRRVQLLLPGDPEREELVLMENGRFALLRNFRKLEGEDLEPGEPAVLLLEP